MRRQVEIRAALSVAVLAFVCVALQGGELPVSTLPMSELAARADALFGQGKWLEARDVYQELLGRFEQAGDVEGIARTLVDQSKILALLGNEEEAEASLRRALGLLPSVAASNGRNIEAKARERLGTIYLARGRSEEGKGEFRKAQDLWRSLRQPGWEFLSLLEMGYALRNNGEYQAALAAVGEARDLQRRFPPDAEAEGDVLKLEAMIDLDLGRFQRALTGLYKAEDLYHQRELSRKLVEVRFLIGTVESSLGRDEQALAIFRKALAESRLDLGSDIAQRVKLMTLVELVQEEKFEQSIELGLQVLPFWEKSNDRETEAIVRSLLGISYLGLEQWDEAFAELSRAAQISPDAKGEKSAAPAEQAIFTLLKGLAVASGAFGQDSETDQGQLGALLALQQEFQEQVQSLESQGEEASFGDELALRQFKFLDRSLAWDQEGALREMEEMVGLLERRGQELTVSELKTSFSGSYSHIYSEAVTLSMAAGRPEAAFDHAEQARARSFVDRIGNQRIAVERGTDTELSREERRLRLLLGRLRDALGVEQRKPLAEQSSDLIGNLQTTREEAEKEYEALRLRLAATSPEYAALVGLKALSLPEVQRQVLDSRTTLVEYFIPESPSSKGGRGQVVAWVVERDRFTMVPLSVSAGDLKDRVALFRNLIESRQPVDPLAAELYRDLFAPLAAQIRRRNLVIVPHGVLHFLPFAALWDGKRYLGDAYTLGYAPSATALKFSREKTARPVGPILALGNPDGSLPHAAKEAEVAARLYRDKPLLGGQATESAIVSPKTRPGILHLAAHAELNPINPLFTSVKLAPDGEHDGNLEMHEVYGLDLSKTGLVVLSGCNTQMGKLSRGDEIEGLTRAFLYAGTPAVMSSLWKVDDESTAFFMERFYRQLRKRKGRAEALQTAQEETRLRFPHPYDWAAFVLTGDGR